MSFFFLYSVITDAIYIYVFAIGFGRVFQGFRRNDTSQKKFRMAYVDGRVR